jgi:CobW/HypB/UreG, nucleotide-binding domain
MSSRPVFVLVGGFLGAGKTSLILAASRVLAGRGLRAAAILNDQGDELVDTRVALEHRLAADQVAGGCFCCRFSDLIEAADRLKAHEPDVIFAEAVGSCTDLAATVLRPLMQDYASRFEAAPLTVVVDPATAAAPLDPDLEFLFRNQIAEADILCCSKADLGHPAPTGARRLSARTGEGVAEWLDEALSGACVPGTKLLELDYERYAQAEAALAWMNCRAVARPRVPVSAPMLAGPLIERIDRDLTAAGIRIVHLKLIDQTPEGFLKAALCGNGREPDAEGALDASPAGRHELLLNLRAAGDPQELRRVVERAVEDLPGTVEWRSMQCFRPSAPRPQRPLLPEQHLRPALNRRGADRSA